MASGTHDETSSKGALVNAILLELKFAMLFIESVVVDVGEGGNTQLENSDLRLLLEGLKVMTESVKECRDLHKLVRRFVRLRSLVRLRRSIVNEPSVKKRKCN